MFKFFSKLLDSNEKALIRLKPLLERINSLEKEVKSLKEEQFKEKTAEFKIRLSKGETLDDILPEAFALVREAALRTIGERPFDVQVLVAIALYRGMAVEQRTGEGKTLSASMPLYLNSLTKRGVHLVTVNDYLARVGCGWMGPIFNLLNVSVSAMIHDQSFLYDPKFEDKDAQDWRLKFLRPISRKEAYQADVTYGINSEFGFDYLRDNMVSDIGRIVQREQHFAIVDEVDSVLIDEARTPHIISAPDTKPTEKYHQFAKLVQKLTSKMDYEVDEKLRTASLTEHGILKIEKMLGFPNLYEKDFEKVHLIEAALKARALFKRDKDYIVKDNQVIIVDEFTGRLLHGRRFSEGIHQSIEAKEGVRIQQESRTLATVSLQNYFRMYEKLAGMTGTAATEAEEFHRIYELEVVVIPTHKPLIRKDHSDVVYKTVRAKYGAVAKDIEECHQNGQPVLVGTTSIENNEIIAQLLSRKGIPHQLLNAKHHQKEAMIIAQAGKKGAVTVATNMAGRGVDIILGGAPPNKYTVKDKKEYQRELNEWQKAHDDVIKFGGLHVIGTERHESRRIDNQLRGRSGRQGDPGSSRFFVSLEDEIMRIFGGEQVMNLMTRFNMPEDIPLEHAMVSKSIEQAQIKVEGFHFDSRRHLVDYDDVLNKQREIIYKKRRQFLKGEGLKEDILEKIKGEVDNFVSVFEAEGLAKEEKEKIIREFSAIIPLSDQEKKEINLAIKDKEKDGIIEYLTDFAQKFYEKREKQVSPEVMRQIERWVTLSTIDEFWMNHLDALADLREGVGLRGYAQRDPLLEYKNEAFLIFERLVGSIDYQITHRIFKVHVSMAPRETALQAAARQAITQPAGQGGRVVRPQTSPARQIKKIGRNDLCPCGSGKKFKKCHLDKEAQTEKEKQLFSLYFSDPEKWQKESGIKLKRGK